MEPKQAGTMKEMEEFPKIKATLSGQQKYQTNILETLLKYKR